MPNCHKDIFYNYVDSHDISELFEIETISTAYGQKRLIRCLPDEDLLNICKNLAIEKSLYTMAQNQAERVRTPEQKAVKQFEGVLAETYSHILLRLHFPNYNFERFDLERDSFVYSSNEYDIVMISNGRRYKFEIRNSYSYKTTIEQAYENYDIIGAYVNTVKTHESISDYFIRPFLQLNPVQTWRKYPPSFDAIDNLIDELMSKGLSLYLCCGADKQMMISKGYIKNMNQGVTKYRALKMIDALDMVEFLDSL